MDYKAEIITEVSETLQDLQVQPILFIGSGLSQRYLNAPTWPSLMEMLNLQCPNLERKFAFYEQNHRVDNGLSIDLMAMATTFSKEFQAWAWEDESKFAAYLFERNTQVEDYIKFKVCEIFKNVTESAKKLQDSPYAQEIELLKKIQPHSIITTNYDGMMEYIFPKYEKVVGQKIIRANYTLYGEILKIHGCYEDLKSLVLTTEDYSNFEQKKKYLSSKLLTYFAEHPLFFFGYSCSDPNIISILSDIDEILAPEGELIPNIYMLIWDKDFNEQKNYPKEQMITIGGNKSIRIKVIYANEFDWIYEAIGEYSPEINIDPKLLRTLLSKVYKLVSSDIPKKELEYNFDLLNSIAEGDEELPKLFGISSLTDAQSFHANFKYTISEVAQKLGFSSWNYADKLMKEVKNKKDVDLKATDNIYHTTIRSGKKSKTELC